VAKTATDVNTMKLFTADHEWVLVEDEVATVGITEHAQNQLGDLVFVDLPEVGRVLEKGEVAATIESVKAASDVYAPLSGKVVERNEAVVSDPTTVNARPVENGWLYRIQIANSDELLSLLDEEKYAALTA
jgi:glycine cleavage system H protein